MIEGTLALLQKQMEKSKSLKDYVFNPPGSGQVPNGDKEILFQPMKPK